ncbi:HIT family protein [Candidatus Woesearchaeota archaeon]|nr:HIT family protein [Candidatus Woesearchaeota archaeon]
MHEKKEDFKLIYEDEIVFCVLHEAPINPGHAILVPNKHTPIFEELTDTEVEHLFNVANKVGTAIFETLGAHGTNILINNGPGAAQEHAHLTINIIPRYENDDADLDWEPKTSKPEDLDQIKELITKSSDKIFFASAQGAEPQAQQSRKELDSDEYSYMYRQTRRIP